MIEIKIQLVKNKIHFKERIQEYPRCHAWTCLDPHSCACAHKNARRP